MAYESKKPNIVSYYSFYNRDAGGLSLTKDYPRAYIYMTAASYSGGDNGNYQWKEGCQFTIDATMIPSLYKEIMQVINKQISNTTVRTYEAKGETKKFAISHVNNNDKFVVIISNNANKKIYQFKSVDELIFFAEYINCFIQDVSNYYLLDAMAKNNGGSNSNGNSNNNSYNSNNNSNNNSYGNNGNSNGNSNKNNNVSVSDVDDLLGGLDGGSPSNSADLDRQVTNALDDLI